MLDENALTIHKAQGSEFELVILVLPNPCRLLSRELIDTALTRQRLRVPHLLAKMRLPSSSTSFMLDT